MLYRNVTNEPQWIVSCMIKTRINPSETINLNPSDLNHSGSNLRNLELVAAQEAVKNQKLHLIEKDYEEMPIEEPLTEVLDIL